MFDYPRLDYQNSRITSLDYFVFCVKITIEKIFGTLKLRGVEIEYNVRKKYDVDHYMLMTMYSQGNAKKNYELSEEFYINYVRLLEKNSYQGNRVIVDTTPLIGYVLGYSQSKCLCNGNDIKYVDSKGQVFKCNPAKQNYTKKSVNIDFEKISCYAKPHICDICIFKDKCVLCEFGLYFGRHKYCQTF